MNDQADNNEELSEDGNDKVDYAKKIQAVDLAIKDALRLFKGCGKTEKAREDYIRKRNALYAQRKYYKKKLLVNELLQQKRVLEEKNAAVRADNQNLEDILSKATEYVRFLETIASSSAPTAAPSVSTFQGQNQSVKSQSVDLFIAPKDLFERSTAAPAAATYQGPNLSADLLTDLLLHSLQRGGLQHQTDLLNSATNTHHLTTGGTRMPASHTDSPADLMLQEFLNPRPTGCLQQLPQADLLRLGNVNPLVDLMLRRQLLLNSVSRGGLEQLALDGATRNLLAAEHPVGRDPVPSTGLAWFLINQVSGSAGGGPAANLFLQQHGEGRLPSQQQNIQELNADQGRKPPPSVVLNNDSTAVDVLLALHNGVVRQAHKHPTQ
jgi:hypothetical protein